MANNNNNVTFVTAYLKTYETDDKYKGLEEYEWNTT